MIASAVPSGRRGARWHRMAGAVLVDTRWSVAVLVFGAVLRRDGRSLWFSLGACSIAAIVAAFQFAVYTSFLEAGAAAPRALAADAWISESGIDCFDFPTPLADGYRGALLADLPGARIERVVVGFTAWVSPQGRRGNVALIGSDTAGLGPQQFRADVSDLQRLQLSRPDQEASIGGVAVQSSAAGNGLATFLGAPYVVMAYDTAHAILHYPAETAAFLTVRFPAGAPVDLARRLARIEARFPELSARTAADFEARSSAYWQNKTGAGLAILLAAVLASLLMVLLLVNSVGRFVQRRQSDIVSMLGHGASAGQIQALLLAMAGSLIAASLALTLICVPIVVAIASPWLPWVTVKAMDVGFAVAIAALCLVASLVSARRELKRFPADAIFRS
ncbi:MAG: hypothetical protein H7268_03010 [Sandarakinorhabdus sp.]|nr:hypothetical protein [Sandarakinorhabdus sp.]